MLQLDSVALFVSSAKLEQKLRREEINSENNKDTFMKNNFEQILMSFYTKSLVFPRTYIVVKAYILNIM